MWRGALKADDSSQHPRRFLPQCVLFYFSWESVSSLQPCDGATTNVHSTRNLCLNLLSSYSCSRSCLCHRSIVAPTWNLNPDSCGLIWIQLNSHSVHQALLKCSPVEAQFPSPPTKNERSCQGHINCVSPPHQQKAFHILTSGGIQFVDPAFLINRETLWYLTNN